MSPTVRSSINVLLVDDSTLVREGICTVIAAYGKEAGIKVVGQAGSVAECLAEVARLRPDVVLLDIRLPDGSGLAACRQILREHPTTCVLILTSYADDGVIYNSVVAGARGYLMKEIDPAGLIEAVVAGAEGRAVLSSEMTSRVFRIIRGTSPESAGADFSLLSPQQLRVIELVATGLTNKEVGEQLGLSANTVKNYLLSACEKLNVSRRAQVAALYARNRRPDDTG